MNGAVTGALLVVTRTLLGTSASLLVTSALSLDSILRFGDDFRPGRLAKTGAVDLLKPTDPYLRFPERREKARTNL